MSKDRPSLPSSGGSYVRQPDGSLERQAGTRQQTRADRMASGEMGAAAHPGASENAAGGDAAGNKRPPGPAKAGPRTGSVGAEPRQGSKQEARSGNAATGKE